MMIKNISDSSSFEAGIPSDDSMLPGYKLESLDTDLSPVGTVPGVSGEEQVGYLDDCDLQRVSYGVYELVRIKENGGWQRDITPL